MKLAFLIFKYYPYGGLQRECLRFAEYCAAQGHAVTIFTLQWLGAKPSNIEVQLLAKRGFSNHKRAKNFCRTAQPLLKNFDRVIGFDRMPNCDFYYVGDVCFAATAALKHGFWFKYSARFRDFIALERSVFQVGAKTKIFVLTDLVKQQYQHYYQTEDSRFILIPPGIQQPKLSYEEIQANKNSLKQQLGLQGAFTLLQVGSDFNRKGVDRTLAAMAALPSELKIKTHLYIIGRGNSAQYQKLAAQLQVAELVHFVGTTDALASYMQAADLLLHTAYLETAGMVLVEALTHALPVIVTANCGFAFHIKRAQAGVVLDEPYSQGQLNRELLTLLQAELLEKLAKSALHYAEHTDLYSMHERCLAEIEK